MTERYLELVTTNDFEGLQRQHNENLSNGRTPFPDVSVVQAAIKNKNVEMFRYLMETMNAEWDISYFFEAACDLECTKYIYEAWMKDEYWSGELPYILWQGHGIAQAAYKG